jgi:hypothetical protein
MLADVEELLHWQERGITGIGGVEEEGMKTRFEAAPITRRPRAFGKVPLVKPAPRAPDGSVLSPAVYPQLRTDDAREALRASTLEAASVLQLPAVVSPTGDSTKRMAGVLTQGLRGRVYTQRAEEGRDAPSKCEGIAVLRGARSKD